MDFSLANILSALGLTFLAGMATGVGGLIAFFTRRTDTRLLSAALGLSAGVMVYVSFMDLLPEALEQMEPVLVGKGATLAVLAAFFAGIGLIALIDFLVPEDDNPHEMHRLEELTPEERRSHHLHRTGIMVAAAITVHNFPEGVASFISALDSLDVAIPIIVAIAIHNIPEGIATSVPIYYSTGSRSKALWFSILAGLSEPLGAIVALMLIMPFWTPAINSLMLAGVAGIMVYISIDELLPSAESYGHHHTAIAGFIAGMVVMALSLLMF